MRSDTDYTGDSFIFSAGSTDIEETRSDDQFQLNYPNPFSTGSLISYSVPSACHQQISISDLSGREVAILANERKLPGSYEIEWNAEGLESGIYLCACRSGNRVITVRIVLIN